LAVPKVRSGYALLFSDFGGDVHYVACAC